VDTDENPHEGEAELNWVAAAEVAGLARLEVRRGGHVLGDLDYRACSTCRIAVLEQIRVDPVHRRRGLGARLVVAVLAAHPGYVWSTTALADTAGEFWDAINWPGLRGDPHWCPHMHQVDERSP
jgi:GNAT superfamily N-acetyltransferase